MQLKHFYAAQWSVNSMKFINERLCIFVTKIPLWTSFHLPPRMRWFQLSRFHFKNKIFGVVRFTKVIYHLVVGFTESLHKNHFLHIQCGWKIDYFTFELQKSLTYTRIMTYEPSNFFVALHTNVRIWKHLQCLTTHGFQDFKGHMHMADGGMFL